MFTLKMKYVNTSAGLPFGSVTKVSVGLPSDFAPHDLERSRMPLIETALTRLLGIEHPILLAPMGSDAVGKLAAAITHAEGLGRIGSGYASTAAIKKELAEARGSA